MTKPRGGHRPNAGALVRNIHLSESEARTLRMMVESVGAKATVENSHNYVVNLINREWREHARIAEERAITLENEARITTRAAASPTMAAQGKERSDERGYTST